MKNFRIFDGSSQYVAADHCEITPRNIVFYALGKIVKSCEPSHVKRVEELDNGMRATKVVYQTAPL